MEWGKPPRAEKLWSLFTVSKKRTRWEVNFTELCSQQNELHWIKLITKALNLSSKQKVLGVSADKKLSEGRPYKLYYYTKSNSGLKNYA